MLKFSKKVSDLSRIKKTDPALNRTCSNVILSNCTKSRTDQPKPESIWGQYPSKFLKKMLDSFVLTHLKAQIVLQLLVLGIANRPSVQKILKRYPVTHLLSCCCTYPSGRLHAEASAFRADPDIYIPYGIQEFGHCHTCISAFESLMPLDSGYQFQIF